MTEPLLQKRLNRVKCPKVCATFLMRDFSSNKSVTRQYLYMRHVSPSNTKTRRINRARFSFRNHSTSTWARASLKISQSKGRSASVMTHPRPTTFAFLSSGFRQWRYARGSQRTRTVVSGLEWQGGNRYEIVR